MSADALLSLFLPDDAATTQLGKLLARYLQAGDVVLLNGSVGAGKTHLSRALIRQKLGRDEDIPSPTFTLVQTYETDECEIWHADLYRLSHPDEALELGLDAAFETAICLVEWPDRLGRFTPADALHIDLKPEGEGRIAQISGGRSGLVAQLKADYDGQ
ncbi:tRNA (adenosine(37)-N6)-threonylcarbamoyltransferase complex ATPase subunit type 1 TsaE [Pseudorhodobacter turbinis]|uniref:tRNA threonylcarbamoyladenosine biosynthesis protein TsaE n=1 Tax=Pseudorhodobacter turbinis TaxID=2500533 RepID=A0A4V1E0U6_9RHOB|nr:tRNA (adenosine(37)-N6)-threonylcarbamoyltransferase complex ATPase subunit type 1 TsaE [Pseudorhodobacter turbinis]QCO55864.1 tRNA (adenosine(37)-N6)-threonylcarbamoyltransferase complex ATPase subunit type 1 TsaE [Pseudorhodobacter turbinis]